MKQEMCKATLIVFVCMLCIGLVLCSSEDEAGNLAKVFDDMDKNGNKEVSFKEVSDFLKTKGLGMDADSEDFKKIVQSFFDSYDKNKDKTITKDEFAPNHDEL